MLKSRNQGFILSKTQYPYIQCKYLKIKIVQRVLKNILLTTKVIKNLCVSYSQKWGVMWKILVMLRPCFFCSKIKIIDKIRWNMDWS